MYSRNLASATLNQQIGSHLNARNLNGVNIDALTNKEIYSNIDLYPEVAADRFANNVAKGLRDKLVEEGLLPPTQSSEEKT